VKAARALTRIVIDTHAWVWSIYETAKVPGPIRTMIAGAETVVIPTVAIHEIGQKVRRDRWPGLDVQLMDKLIADADGRFEFAPLTPEIARRASVMDWDHRDPFDRIIAATALELRAPLVSMDRVFDGTGGLERLWDW
jgi:PIN domain nuclease of toxin-antitoxin system